MNFHLFFNVEEHDIEKSNVCFVLFLTFHRFSPYEANCLEKIDNYRRYCCSMVSKNWSMNLI